jgi:hypothetical protein
MRVAEATADSATDSRDQTIGLAAWLLDILRGYSLLIPDAQVIEALLCRNSFPASYI